MAVKESDGTKATRTRGPNRPYPRCTLEEALSIAKTIRERNPGRPFNRILLAEAVHWSPGSSGFRDLIAASAKYGLTKGNFLSPEIELTPTGQAVVAPRTEQEARVAVAEAAMAPEVFGQFYRLYDQKKLPDDQLACNVLQRDLGVPHELTGECLEIIRRNGFFAGVFREVSGSTWVMLADQKAAAVGDATGERGGRMESPAIGGEPTPPPPSTSLPSTTERRKIFIGHGKEHGPVQKIENILNQFQIPCAVVMDEPNRGRPISEKVAEIMRESSAAILVFTRDEELRDVNGGTVWRPSENVIFELGAASVLYGKRIVIYKEEGINFPTNFKDLGYIPFDRDRFEASGLDLIKELIGLGLLKVAVW